MLRFIALPAADRVDLVGKRNVFTVNLVRVDAYDWTFTCQLSTLYSALERWIC